MTTLRITSPTSKAQIQRNMMEPRRSTGVATTKLHILDRPLSRGKSEVCAAVPTAVLPPPRPSYKQRNPCLTARTPAAGEPQRLRLSLLRDGAVLPGPRAEHLGPREPVRSAVSAVIELRISEGRSRRLAPGWTTRASAWACAWARCCATARRTAGARRGCSACCR